MAQWYKHFLEENKNCEYGTFYHQGIPFTYKISFLTLTKPRWNYKKFYFHVCYDKEMNILRIKCDERFLKYKWELKKRIENWIDGYLHLNCDSQDFADHMEVWIIGIKYHLIIYSLTSADKQDSYYKIQNKSILIYSKPHCAYTKFWLHKIKMDIGYKFFSERTKLLATKINRFENVKTIIVGEYSSFNGLCTYLGIENNIPKYELKFSIKVLSAPIDALDSLIYHELAHIDHMNHRKGFYNLCHKYCEYYTQKINKLDKFYEW